MADASDTPETCYARAVMGPVVTYQSACRRPDVLSRYWTINRDLVSCPACLALLPKTLSWLMDRP